MSGVLIATSIVTAVAVLIYTVFAGLQWWQIKKQVGLANEQVGKMQLQLEAINKQEEHLSDQAKAAGTQAEAMQGQLAVMRDTLTHSERQILLGETKCKSLARP